MNKQYHVYIQNLGCDKRALDAGRISEYFKKNNCVICFDPDDADYLMLVTCGFLETRLELSLEWIRKLKRKKGELIVLGCMPGIHREKLKEVFDGSFLSTKNLDKIDSIFPFFDIPFKSISDTNIGTVFTDKLIEKTGVSREELAEIYKDTATLRIASGCNNRCSYCVIPLGIGAFRSKKIDEIEKEYINLINNGIHNFVITADDTGAYGRDIGTNFSDLLVRLDKISIVEGLTWEISCLNPCWVDDAEEVLYILAKKSRLKSVEIDIQSGSPRILQLMNRPVDLEKLSKVILRLKNADPKLSIKSQFIIGFPSETSKDFNDTISFIKKSKLIDKNDFLQYIPYSDMRGSIAYCMQEKVQKTEINKRVEIFKNLFSPEEYSLFPEF